MRNFAPDRRHIEGDLSFGIPPVDPPEPPGTWRGASGQIAGWCWAGFIVIVFGLYCWWMVGR